MRRTAIALASALCVLTLAMGAAASVPRAGSAQENPTIIYFPWVANGEMLGGQGPWYSHVSFQNLAPDACAVSVFVGRDGSFSRTAQLSLTRSSSRSVAAASLGVPVDGAPVRFEAYCPITASVKTTTPGATRAPWSDGARVVTGYSGIRRMEVDAARATAGSAWLLPIVQTNSDWNTIVRLANLSATSASDVTIQLFPAGNSNGLAGAVQTLTRRLGPAETWTVDVQATLGTTGFVGFARVNSVGVTGVVALRSKPVARMALTNVAVAADGSPPGTYRTYAPLLFNAYNGWNTGINLANPSERTANVTLRYFAAGGGFLREEQLVLPALSMQFVYTPGNIPQEGFVGSATIESNTPVVAAIDEVKYETVEALSYMASAVPQSDASIPVVFREDPPNGQHDNSGINIVNLNRDAEQVVRISLTSTTGQLLVDPINLLIPAGSNAFVYLPFVQGLPSGTVASARITAGDAAGFVAISNDINYAASGDGSVVFVAGSDAGYYHVPMVP